jgi:hypothetical protein
MTVAEMRRRMSQTEFVHWAALYKREQLEREKAEARAKAKRGR